MPSLEMESLRSITEAGCLETLEVFHVGHGAKDGPMISVRNVSTHRQNVIGG